jgi:hypothetical protein
VDGRNGSGIAATGPSMVGTGASRKPGMDRVLLRG